MKRIINFEKKHTETYKKIVMKEKYKHQKLIFSVLFLNPLRQYFALLLAGPESFLALSKNASNPKGSSLTGTAGLPAAFSNCTGPERPAVWPPWVPSKPLSATNFFGGFVGEGGVFIGCATNLSFRKLVI